MSHTHNISCDFSQGVFGEKRRVFFAEDFNLKKEQFTPSEALLAGEKLGGKNKAELQADMRKDAEKKLNDIVNHTPANFQAMAKEAIKASLANSQNNGSFQTADKHNGGDNLFSKEEFDAYAQHLETEIKAISDVGMQEVKALTDANIDQDETLPAPDKANAKKVNETLAYAGLNLESFMKGVNENIAQLQAPSDSTISMGGLKKKLRSSILSVLATKAKDIQIDNKNNPYIVNQVLQVESENITKILIPATQEYIYHQSPQYTSALWKHIDETYKNGNPAQERAKIKSRLQIFEKEILSTAYPTEIPTGILGNASFFTPNSLSQFYGEKNFKEQKIGNAPSLEDVSQGLTPLTFLSPELTEIDDNVQTYVIACAILFMAVPAFDLVQGADPRHDLTVEMAKKLSGAPDNYNVQLETWEIALNVVTGIATATGLGVFLSTALKGGRLAGKLARLKPEKLMNALKKISKSVGINISKFLEKQDISAGSVKATETGRDNLMRSGGSEKTLGENTTEKFFSMDAVFKNIISVEDGYIILIDGKYIEIIKYDEIKQMFKCKERPDIPIGTDIVAYNKAIDDKILNKKLNTEGENRIFLSRTDFLKNIETLSDEDFYRNKSYIVHLENMNQFSKLHVSRLQGKSLKEEIKEIAIISRRKGNQDPEVIRRMQEIQNMNEYNKKLGAEILTLYDSEFNIARKTSKDIETVFSDPLFNTQINKLVITMSKEAQQYFVQTLGKVKNNAIERGRISTQSPQESFFQAFGENTENVDVEITPWAISFTVPKDSFKGIRETVGGFSSDKIDGFNYSSSPLGSASVSTKGLTKIIDHEDLHAKAGAVAPFLTIEKKGQINFKHTLDSYIQNKDWSNALLLTRTMIKNNLRENLKRAMDEIHSYTVGNNLPHQSITQILTERITDSYAYEQALQKELYQSFESAPSNIQTNLTTLINEEQKNYNRVVGNLSKLGSSLYGRNGPNSLLTINLEHLADDNYQRFLPNGYRSDMFRL